MNELARKFEHKRKTLDDLAKEVSSELKYTNGNFAKACDRVLDKEGIVKDFEERLKLKSAIGKILGEHSASLKTKKSKIKIAVKSRELEQIMRDAHISRIKKIQERNPLFGEEIAEKEGLSKLERE